MEGYSNKTMWEKSGSKNFSKINYKDLLANTMQYSAVQCNTKH